MGNIIGTSFATGNFSFDPNLSPNNAAFAAAVRAVMNQGGYTVPATGLPAGDFANPSVKVALTATSGVSTLAMRSDGAPALDVTISPTWTGTHTFTGGPVQCEGAVVVGTSTLYSWGSSTTFWPALQIGGCGGIMPESTGPELLLVAGAWFNGTAWVATGTGTNNAGTSTASLLTVSAGGIVVSAGGVGTYTKAVTFTTIFQVGGTVSPVVQGYGPTAAALVDMTPDTGSFNGTMTGFTNANLTVGFNWSKQGNQVILTVGNVTGSSNTTSWTIGQLPAEITPARNQNVKVGFLEDNAAFTDGVFQVSSGGIMTLFKGATPTGSTWTNSSTKGFSAACTFSYMLN